MLKRNAKSVEYPFNRQYEQEEWLQKAKPVVLRQTWKYANLTLILNIGCLC